MSDGVSRAPTYVSLFSSAGVGCYGFKMAGFECVATNELIARRLDVQRFNRKCRLESGYILGDVSDDAVRAELLAEIERWERDEGLDRVDVVVATPPCQGMSVANQKKRATEIVRNSLVVESLRVIERIRPRFFVLENVPAFARTECVDADGSRRSIGDAVEAHLGRDYDYEFRVMNFKDFGSCSSRRRTLVVGVARDAGLDVTPADLYPDPVPERTLREVIGGMRPLTRFGEIDDADIYHAFRVYPEYMRAWISGLAEGASAFDNADPARRPHRVVDGRVVPHRHASSQWRTKYARQSWDRVGACVHTRNDQLGSQSTIHPRDDRVFSVRELMRLMTVPDSFRWVAEDEAVLNALPEAEKRAFLKREEIKIRQSLGEAVPTEIFHAVAEKIAGALRMS